MRLSKLIYTTASRFYSGKFGGLTPKPNLLPPHFIFFRFFMHRVTLCAPYRRRMKSAVREIRRSRWRFWE